VPDDQITKDTERRRLRRAVNALAIDLTPLKVSRDYRLLFTGQFVSVFGSAISYVVLPWQVYQLTRSPFAVGLLGVAEFVPMLAMGFVGGALADHFDRRRLIALTEIGLAGCCGLLVFNSLLAEPRVWLIFLVSSLVAALVGLERPAREALTPQLVPAELLPAVSALNSLRFNFGHIVGPSVAGLIAVKFGAAAAYAVDLVTFLVSLATLLLMRAVPKPAGAGAIGLHSVIEGLRYARSRQELLGTYLIDLIAMFFGMPMALFPAIAERFGAESLGLLYAFVSVGALAATLTSGWTERVRRHGLAITLAAGAWGAAIVGFGLADKLWLALFFLALAGAADNVSGLFRMTMWNQTVPTHLRGRLAGIEMISYTTGPYLGNAEAGLVASLFGLRASVVSGGVLCVVGALALALLLPAFIRYDSRAGLARKEAEEAARAMSAANG
jgi:MFS family permease